MEQSNQPRCVPTIKDVVFLTPARVDYEVDGVEYSSVMSIDIINRKAYGGDVEDKAMSQLIFDYLDRINTLPEDFFAAPDEVVEEAERAKRSYQEIQDQTLGVTNE